MNEEEDDEYITSITRAHDEAAEGGYGTLPNIDRNVNSVYFTKGDKHLSHSHSATYPISTATTTTDKEASVEKGTREAISATKDKKKKQTWIWTPSCFQMSARSLKNSDRFDDLREK